MILKQNKIFAVEASIRISAKKPVKSKQHQVNVDDVTVS